MKVEVVLTDKNGCDFTLLLEDGKVTPKEIWEEKDVWMKQVEDSKEIWNTMESEQKDAVQRMVISAIERMHDRVEDWLPEALEVEGGSFVDVKMRFLFTDIDREIERHEQATSFQIKGAAKQLAETLSEFGENTTDG